MSQLAVRELGYFRWWDYTWLLSKFYWPLASAGEQERIYKMPLSKLRFHVASLSEYRSQENGATWFDMDQSTADSGDSDKPSWARSAGKKSSKPITYEDWEIKSPAEYDAIFLPSCGDANWAKHGITRG